jgi:antitoxin (DNA-binding transcriptional repressor) of toxin-antitoxin stability system
MAIIAILEEVMRSVNVAKLKNQLSKYLTYAKSGEEIVIRERDLPVAKLVPLSIEDVDERELALVAAGKLRLPKAKLDLKEFTLLPTGRIKGNGATQALLKDREESL